MAVDSEKRSQDLAEPASPRLMSCSTLAWLLPSCMASAGVPLKLRAVCTLVETHGAERRVHTTMLRLAFASILMLTSFQVLRGQAAGPNVRKPAQGPVLCNLESLPLDVQTHLKRDFASWKVQEPADLSTFTHGRWESEMPLACPGIATGRFDDAKNLSYAVLLVPQGHLHANYKFLVFSPKAGQQAYDMLVLDSGDSGAANLFIRAVRVSKFFNEASRTKFKVQTSECILFVDAAESEYETDVYFWTDGRYRQEPVDY